MVAILEEDGTPKWSQIAVSGQSQGAGQAALIGTIRQVDRVVMFSGPPDMYSKPVNGEVVIDPWISIGKTPASKYFALFHDRDHLVVGIRANLTALDMEHLVLRSRRSSARTLWRSPYIFSDLRPTLGYARPNPPQSTARATTPIGPEDSAAARCLALPVGQAAARMWPDHS